MEEIIDKVPREVLLAELTPDKKLRSTNKSGNDIYIVTTRAPSPSHRLSSAKIPLRPMSVL